MSTLEEERDEAARLLHRTFRAAARGDQECIGFLESDEAVELLDALGLDAEAVLDRLAVKLDG